jgi:hypothetical protein
MKFIKYKFVSCEINNGTEEAPSIEEITVSVKLECPTQEVFDSNYPIAEKEAIPGTIEVVGEFEPEPQVEPVEDRVAELESALNLLLEGATE